LARCRVNSCVTRDAVSDVFDGLAAKRRFEDPHRNIPAMPLARLRLVSMVIMLLRLDNIINSSKLIRLDNMAHRLHLLIHDISHKRCNDGCHVKCFSLVLEQMINETVQDITPFCQPPFGVGPSYTTTIQFASCTLVHHHASQSPILCRQRRDSEGRQAEMVASSLP
jgi:hypothetical protein